MKVVATVLAMALVLGQPAEAEIWLCGLDPVTRLKKDPAHPSDFMALFAPGAPWAQAASKVNVFKISSAFVLQGTDSDLRTTFAWLSTHHIALALEIGVLSGDGVCGKGMEGYSNQTTATTIARRVQRLGGDLAYVAMDEQLWFGHFVNSSNACHSPIPDIAREVAGHVAEMRAIFPNVRAGTIEPIIDLEPVDALREYLDAYRAAAGVPFAFLHGDVQWARAWQAPLQAVAKLARGSGIPFGVIIDSDQRTDNGVEWTNNARGRLAAVHQVVGAPDHLIVQSWTMEPRRWLPEQDPGTMTHLVDSLHD
jgi:hypothetical protein